MAIEKPISKLLQAAENGNFALCEELLLQGADVMARQSGGRTALHVAAWKGYLDICRLLVQHGAKVDDKDWYKRTPIHVAVEHGRIPVVQYFLDECDQDINQRNVIGKTLDQLQIDGQSEQEMKAFLAAYRNSAKTEQAVHDAMRSEEAANLPSSRPGSFSPL
jgi:ankyrin repeat protein